MAFVAGRESRLTDRATRQLRNDIRTGRLVFGQALPSEARLCQRFSVSRITVRRALACLKNEQLIESRAGVGHFVIAKPDSLHTARPARTELLYVHNMGRGESLQSLAAAIFSGAAEEALKRRLELFLCCQDAHGFRRVVQQKNETSLRGVLFDWNDPEVARFLIEGQIPFIVLEGDYDDLPVASVVQDDVGGTIAALDHLFALGHRRIGYLGPDDGWVHSRRRMAGYRQFHLERNLPIDQAFIAFPKEQNADGLACAERLLESDPKPSALFVADRCYLPGLQMAMEARGIKIPKDLSIVVWGDSNGAAQALPWTRVSWDRVEMGRLAVRVLEDRLSSGSTSRLQVLLPARLVAGETTTALKTTD